MKPRAPPSEHQRSAAIPEQSKWRLTDLYARDDAWRAAKEKLAARIEEVKKIRGTLGQSPQQLADGLILNSDLNKEFARLYVYAGLISDQDTRDTKYRAMKQEMDQPGSIFAAETAFIEPEILKLDRATIDGYVAHEPKLAPYTFYLRDLLPPPRARPRRFAARRDTPSSASGSLPRSPARGASESRHR
ncbi:MAG: hypothetical protein ACRD3J_27025 [Thermoanaerobaculia bacterium]